MNGRCLYIQLDVFTNLLAGSIRGCGKRVGWKMASLGSSSPALLDSTDSERSSQTDEEVGLETDENKQEGKSLKILKGHNKELR